MTREQLLEKVKNELPETSGVYIMKNVANEVIYVGKANATIDSTINNNVKIFFMQL